MASKISWEAPFKALLRKYKDNKHPLNYKNPFQLMVMVILSAQSTDKLINSVTPEFFAAYPDMESLSRANEEDLVRHLRKVRNFRNKAKWLMQVADRLKGVKKLPSTMKDLTALPGIGRKSASVIMRENGLPPDGVIVDLHVVRVAPRIGIATGTDPKKIELQIMEALPQTLWDAGMAMSFLGRETCRPTNPHCPHCVMKKVCRYYKSHKPKVNSQA